MSINFIDQYGFFGFRYYCYCFNLYFNEFDFPNPLNLKFLFRQRFNFEILLGFDFSQTVLVIHSPAIFEILSIGNLCSC